MADLDVASRDLKDPGISAPVDVEPWDLREERVTGVAVENVHDAVSSHLDTRASEFEAAFDAFDGNGASVRLDGGAIADEMRASGVRSQYDRDLHGKYTEGQLADARTQAWNRERPNSRSVQFEGAGPNEQDPDMVGEPLEDAARDDQALAAPLGESLDPDLIADPEREWLGIGAPEAEPLLGRERMAIEEAIDLPEGIEYEPGMSSANRDGFGTGLEGSEEAQALEWDSPRELDGAASEPLADEYEREDEPAIALANEEEEDLDDDLPPGVRAWYVARSKHDEL